MKTLTHLLILGLLLASLALTVAPARADCPDGTAGAPDTINCTGPDSDGSNGGGSGAGTDTWNVDSTATVDGTAYGIIGSGDMVVNNDGTITGQAGPGIVVADAGTVNNNGDISGSTGVLMSDGSVQNTGQITGNTGDGVSLDPNATETAVTNSGQIQGAANGVANYSGAANLVVTNDGTISGGFDGVHSDGTGTVVNNGTISGTTDAGVQLSLGGTVINNGQINSEDYVGVGFYNGSGTLTNNGTIDGGEYGNYTNQDLTAVNNGTISSGEFGVVVDGNADIQNNGSITTQGLGNEQAILVAQDATITNNGLLSSADGYAVEVDGQANIVNNGTIEGGSAGIITEGGDSTIINNGTITGDSGLAIGTAGGNDTVILGGGGVSYGTSCGDISVTSVNAQQSVVNGLMDASTGTDSLTIGYVTADGASADTLAGQLAALDPANGSITVNGSTYTWQNFESLNLSTTTYHEGPTRLYDDGVVLAFTSANGNGIDVCSGPNGFRVGTIDFATLQPDASGQTFSAGNQGWFLKVFALGNHQFQVNVYDGTGQLINYQFIFTH